MTGQILWSITCVHGWGLLLALVEILVNVNLSRFYSLQLHNGCTANFTIMPLAGLIKLEPFSPPWVAFTQCAAR